MKQAVQAMNTEKVEQQESLPEKGQKKDAPGTIVQENPLPEKERRKDAGTVSVRAAAPQDYEAVARLMGQVQALHVAWRPDIYRLVEPVFSREEYEALLRDDTVLAAERGGDVCAVMILKERLANAPVQVPRYVLFVDSLAVDEDGRGQGTGSLLMEYAMRLASEKGMDGVELQVNAKNTLARKFYEKLGFTEKSINLERAARTGQKKNAPGTVMQENREEKRCHQ